MKRPHVVIVGGGTAGWIVANILCARGEAVLGQPVDVTLVESPDIPIIGVGEATTPSIRLTLSAIGIDEHTFMQACDATFKHGIRFEQWTHAPDACPGESYFHPFEHPARLGLEQLAHFWRRTPADTRSSFANLASIQEALAQSGLAPRRFDDAPYQGMLPYAYHIDAGKLANFLAAYARTRGVQHLRDNVEEVVIDEGGSIEGLKLAQHPELKGDLYIDCTGFRTLLLGAVGDDSFVSKSDTLFCDRAIVTRRPVHRPDAVRPFTRSVAQRSGWIWDINLTERCGIGHVYSSSHQSDEEALSVLAAYIGASPDAFESRLLKMRIGYTREAWRRNVVAIGLSGGFVEPLESTGIYLIEMASWMLVQLLPRFFSGADASKQFNTLMARHYENIVDFIKAHYAFSERTDSAFWRDNTDKASWSASLLNLWDRWATDTPCDYDFDHRIQCFSAANYQYVLFGMGASSDTPPDLMRAAEFAPFVELRRRRLALARQSLEPHHTYLARIASASPRRSPASLALASATPSYQLF